MSKKLPIGIQAFRLEILHVTDFDSDRARPVRLAIR